MTIEAWNILLSAVILVLMTVGGFWLKYVVEQQLKSKDTAIQALEGVVQLKNAHIAVLEGDTAPAIAKAYAVMRDHANVMTEQAEKLTVQLGQRTQNPQIEQESLEARILIGEVHGLYLASTHLDEHVWKLLAPHKGSINPKLSSEDFALLLDGLNVTSEQINQEMKTRLETASDLTKTLKS